MRGYNIKLVGIQTDVPMQQQNGNYYFKILILMARIAVGIELFSQHVKSFYIY